VGVIEKRLDDVAVVDEETELGELQNDEMLHHAEVDEVVDIVGADDEIEPMVL
jgi:hypothetical protein